MRWAQNSLHYQSLQTVLGILGEASIPTVLLKGSSLAQAAYGDAGLRPMFDVDIWLQEAHIPDAVRLIRNAGYEIHKKDRLPLDRQRELEGELELGRPNWSHGMIDLHWDAFHGWWFQYCANIDHQAIWQRKTEITIGEHHAYRMETEDLLLHLAAHASVNAHFGPHIALRTLIDIALVCQAWPPNWRLLTHRAREMRLSYALWCVLNLFETLIGDERIALILPEIAPSPARQHYLSHWVTPESVLGRRNISPTKKRFPLIFGLAERPQDVAHFMTRTIIPPKSWLNARYGQPTTSLQHLVHILKK